MPSKNDTQRSLTDIEIALARLFDYMKNTVVFNVRGESWLFPLTHEADMLVVGKDRKLCEIEIKRTYADFCADFDKRHLHDSTDSIGIERFYYAIPAGIHQKAVKVLEQERAVPSGIITYDEDLKMTVHKVLFSTNPEMEGKSYGSTYIQAYPYNSSLSCGGVNVLLLKNAIKLDFRDGFPNLLFNRGARPLFTEQLIELQRLGCMRQVALREKITKLEQKLAKESIIQSYEDKICNLETILNEYRSRFREETGYQLDEKEILFG